MRQAGITVVCVFNDAAVRQQCLDASLSAADMSEVQYITIDNTTGTFPTAGAALNHGAKLAHHAVIAFVHQDVYFHSLEALLDAAELLVSDPTIGVVGAVGIDRRGEVAGRIRDRVDMSGPRVCIATPVDSVDEVAFLVERDRLLGEELSEDADLGWHAYAVEYGARMRRAGLQVVVTDIPLTHNSLTINLARLNVAHAAVARKYPELLPINTTCGAIRSTPTRPRAAWSRRLRRESRFVRDLLYARRAVGWGPELCVSNIRFDIDHLIAGSADVLVVVNIVEDNDFPQDVDPLRLSRRGRLLELSSGDIGKAVERLSAADPQVSCLVTDVPATDVAMLLAAREDAVVGFDRSTGFWVAVGPLAAMANTPKEWSGRRYRGRSSSKLPKSGIRTPGALVH